MMEGDWQTYRLGEGLLIGPFRSQQQAVAMTREGGGGKKRKEV